MATSIDQGLAAYVQFYESLEESSLEQLRQLVTADVKFRDPFNDVVGVEAYLHVLRDMFSRCDQPRFTVSRTWLEENRAILKWEYRFLAAGSQSKWEIHGLSELKLSSDGKIESHIDYWDAASQLYQRLPLIGWIIRRIQDHLRAK